jgi:hypothetical protein
MRLDVLADEPTQPGQTIQKRSTPEEPDPQNQNPTKRVLPSRTCEARLSISLLSTSSMRVVCAYFIIVSWLGVVIAMATVPRARFANSSLNNATVVAVPRPPSANSSKNGTVASHTRAPSTNASKYATVAPKPRAPSAIVSKNVTVAAVPRTPFANSSFKNSTDVASARALFANSSSKNAAVVAAPRAPRNNSSQTFAPAIVPPTNGTDSPTSFVETEFPTVAPFVVPSLQDCYTNLNDLQAIVRAKDPFSKEVYKLCPNTVFEMGFLNASNVCCVNGHPPLWPRRDTTYQCGDDGSSANNCTLRGGTLHVISYNEQFSSEEKTNAVFKGLTFEDAAEIAILMTAYGDFTYDDCVFKVCPRSHSSKVLIPGLKPLLTNLCTVYLLFIESFQSRWYKAVHRCKEKIGGEWQGRSTPRL